MFLLTTALWAAREAGAHTVVSTSNTHLSITKAAHLLGMFHRPIRDWDAAVSLDGCCAVITAGATSTGEIEALDAANGALWRHVDAAWAGPLRLSDTHRHLLDGIEHADSVAVSAHKWLFQPKESAMVIESMCGKKPVPGKIMPSDKNTLVGYVSGNVGITGEMKISITVSFSEAAINRIYKAVFPDEAEEVTIFQIGDLVGEVTNMINGNMRRYLSEEDMKFDSSIPTVVVGAQQIYHPQGTIAKVIPFDFDGDFIYLEVGIKAF